MANGLEIVPSALLITYMGANTGITSCSSQVFALSERDVFSIRVLVALSKSEIDDIDVVLVVIVTTNQEIIRLDVSMDDSLFMHFLNTLNLTINCEILNR